MRSTLQLFFGVTAIVLASASAAAAQEAWALNVSANYMDFDLSGTGQTGGLAVRATRNLTPAVVLEVGAAFARPCQQFQDCREIGRATLFAPEAQLQYHWRLGRIEPYVGGGIGAAALRSSSLGTDWEPTLSVATGTAVRLTDRLALTGELRVRGHEWKFVGTTTEISAGLAWRLPQF